MSRTLALWLAAICRAATFGSVAILILSTCALASVQAVASEPRPGERPNRADDDKARASKADDELLKDLDNELLEGAGDLTDRSKSKKPGAAGAGEKDAAAEAVDGEDVGMPAEGADPLVHISQEMRWVEDLVPQPAKRALAEQLQQRIVEDLARLIEQAQSQRGGQSNNSKSKQQRSVAERQRIKQPQQQKSRSPGKDSNKPAQDSTPRLGKAEAARPDPELFKGMMKDAWGHLPPRDREQVLQNTPDKFLPQYELLIEKYYKRLAEDQAPK